MPGEVEPLKLLDDLPVGTSDDEFSHVVYARVLDRLFRSGKPGMCVALFGRWGQGKSSVVRALEEGAEEDCAVIPFNAWKASGDSIRRQLVLRVLDKIAPLEAKRFKRFAGIELVDSLKLSEKEQREKLGKARLLVLRDWRLWIRLFWPLVGFVFMMLAAAVMIGLSFLLSEPQAGLLMQVSLYVPVPAGLLLARYVYKSVRVRYRTRLNIGEPVSDSERLKYP